MDLLVPPGLAFITLYGGAMIGFFVGGGGKLIEYLVVEIIVKKLYMINLSLVKRIQAQERITWNFN